MAKNSYIDSDKRIVYLAGDIDEGEEIGQINSTLLSWILDDNQKDKEQKNFKRKPISLYINSYGGEVYGTWSLIDIILSSLTPIYTYCTGYAMSAGFLIFLAGEKRYASKHARFLYHQLGCIRKGKYQDLVEDREEMDYMQNEIEEYVLNRTSISKEQLQKNREHKTDWIIHLEEAKKLNIITDIITVI